MSSTKRRLEASEDRLAESMGHRSDAAVTRLAPTPHSTDVGRRPAPQFGRVEIQRVMPDPEQPRIAFDDDAIRRLATSLKHNGQLAPIRVRWSEAHSKWLIVAGERRWRAATLADLSTIECHFEERPLDADEVLRLQLVENLLREDLKPIEEARAFRRLMDQQGYTGKQVAAELSIPESKISRSLALLRLPDEVQAQVEDGRIAPRAAYEISRAASPAEQRRLAALAASGVAGVQQISRATRSGANRRSSRRRGVSLTFKLDNGWKVSVTRRQTASYYEVEKALSDALEEVRARIRGGVQLF